MLNWKLQLVQLRFKVKGQGDYLLSEKNSQLMTQLPEIEYFQFEQDFMEDNIRCIPMIVRFKLDTSGIKLKLKEWSKMTIQERELLARLPIDSLEDIEVYRMHVCSMVRNHTGESATELPVEKRQIGWTQMDTIPPVIEE